MAERLYIASLDPEERLDLIGQLWDSLAPEDACPGRRAFPASPVNATRSVYSRRAGRPCRSGVIVRGARTGDRTAIS